MIYKLQKCKNVIHNESGILREIYLLCYETTNDYYSPCKFSNSILDCCFYS